MRMVELHSAVSRRKRRAEIEFRVMGNKVQATTVGWLAPCVSPPGAVAYMARSGDLLKMPRHASVSCHRGSI
jgi:hypothetical protein